MDRSEKLYRDLISAGSARVEEYVQGRYSEELFLDYKRSSDNGSEKRLSTTDRTNLAKAISGFGNSEGGIIIWGVDCAPDKTGADLPSESVPISDASRFVSWLESAISGCTIPAHSKVQNTALLIGNGPSGYVVTHIPKSYEAPHQTIGKLQYLMRAGSSFIPVPHMILAGMFGRPYPPHVFHNYLTTPAKISGDEISFDIGLLIHNKGPGIAQDLHATIQCWEFPGEPCQFALEVADERNWSGNFAFGRFWSFISSPSFRIPPEGQSMPFTFTVFIRGPINSGIRIKGIAGSGTSLPHRFELVCEHSTLERLYQEIVKRNKNGEAVGELLNNFPVNVLGI